MKLFYNTGSRIVGIALLAGLWSLACSSDEGDNTTTTGGKASVGGAAATGGKTGVTGGKTGVTGGASSTARTGGAPAIGGAAAGGASSSTAPKTGGASAIGGTGNVGTTAVGGVTSVGGASASTHVGGATGVGGSTTGGNTGDGGPAADAGVACDGCLKLYVPFATAEGLLPTAEKGTGTDFVYDFGASTPEDLSTSVVTARVYVDTFSTTGGLRLYAINDNSPTYSSAYETWTNLTDLNGGWHVLTLNFATMGAAGDAGTGFDKSKVRWLGLNINSGDGFGTAGASGASLLEEVAVYVDSIQFSDHVHADFTFDANAVDGFAINKYSSPVAGSLLNGVPVAN